MSKLYPLWLVEPDRVLGFLWEARILDSMERQNIVGLVRVCKHDENNDEAGGKERGAPFFVSYTMFVPFMVKHTTEDASNADK